MPSLLKKKSYDLQTSQSFESDNFLETWHYAKTAIQFSGCVQSRNPALEIFSAYAAITCCLQKNIMDFGKSFEYFLKVSTGFWTLFEFFYNLHNQIWDENLEKIFSLVKLIMSKFLTLLTYLSRETTKVLAKSNFWNYFFSWRIGMAISINIKHVPPALAEPVVAFYRKIRKFWFT